MRLKLRYAPCLLLRPAPVNLVTKSDLVGGTLLCLKNKFARSLVVIATTLALGVSTSGVANAAPAATAGSPQQALKAQIEAAYGSAAGQQLRTDLSQLLTNPAVLALAQSVLQTAGPRGTNDLTKSQIKMLDAILAETAHPKVISDILTGRRSPFR